MVSEKEIEAALAGYNSLGKYASDRARMKAALEAAARVRAEDNAGEPVAYLQVQRKSGEKILSFEPLADLPFNRKWWDETPLIARSLVKGGVDE